MNYRVQDYYKELSDEEERSKNAMRQKAIAELQASQVAAPEAYTPGAFTYRSPYEENIRSAADKLMNWEYDPNKDVSYGVYKNQYVNNGQRAYEDALAKYASRTGGVASSYAATAAQQQYDNYMSELSSKIPTLEQAAYERVKNEYNLAKDLEADDRSRAKELYNAQEAQRKAAYNNALSAYEYQQSDEGMAAYLAQLETAVENGRIKPEDAANLMEERYPGYTNSVLSGIENKTEGVTQSVPEKGTVYDQLISKAQKMIATDNEEDAITLIKKAYHEGEITQSEYQEAVRRLSLIDNYGKKKQYFQLIEKAQKMIDTDNEEDAIKLIKKAYHEGEITQSEYQEAVSRLSLIAN